MRIILIILIFIGYKSLVFSQSIVDTLTSDLTEFVNQKEFIGLAVGIVDQDGLIYSRAFWYADEDEKKLYTIHTPQPIATTSKTLIGVALMKA